MNMSVPNYIKTVHEEFRQVYEQLSSNQKDYQPFPPGFHGTTIYLNYQLSNSPNYADNNEYGPATIIESSTSSNIGDPSPPSFAGLEINLHPDIEDRLVPLSRNSDANISSTNLGYTVAPDPIMTQFTNNLTSQDFISPVESHQSYINSNYGNSIPSTYSPQDTSRSIKTSKSQTRIANILQQTLAVNPISSNQEFEQNFCRINSLLSPNIVGLLYQNGPVVLDIHQNHQTELKPQGLIDVSPVPFNGESRGSRCSDTVSLSNSPSNYSNSTELLRTKSHPGVDSNLPDQGSVKLLLEAPLQSDKETATLAGQQSVKARAASRFSKDEIMSIRIDRLDAICEICETKVENYWDFMEHIENHESTKYALRSYQCVVPSCPMSVIGYLKKCSLRHHIHECHFNRGYIIDEFNEWEPELQKFLYTCIHPKCSKAFYRRDSLTRHMKLLHENPVRMFSENK